MGTTGHPAGRGPTGLVTRAVDAVRDHRAFERAVADRRALSELLTGTAEVMTVSETADVPFPPEAVWAVLDDPVTLAHLGTWPVVAAFDLPGAPAGTVGSRRCAVYRLPDGRLEATLSEVVEVEPGRRLRDRALTSPFPLSTTFVVEPGTDDPGRCTARLTATGTAPTPIARQMADEWAAGLRHVMWRVRELLGDPGLAGTTPPVRTDDEQAWLEQLCSLDRRRAQMHAVPVTERCAVDLAVPADVAWHLIADVDSPLVDSGDPTARRFVVPVDDDGGDGPGDGERRPPLLATVSRCTQHSDHLHVEFDEVLENVPMHRVVYRSLRDVRPARTVLRLTERPGGCRVEAESTHEVPAVIRRECRRQLRAALERYLELLQQHAES